MFGRIDPSCSHKGIISEWIVNIFRPGSKNIDSVGEFSLSIPIKYMHDYACFALLRFSYLGIEIFQSDIRKQYTTDRRAGRNVFHREADVIMIQHIRAVVIRLIRLCLHCRFAVDSCNILKCICRIVSIKEWLWFTLTFAMWVYLENERIWLLLVTSVTWEYFSRLS